MDDLLALRVFVTAVRSGSLAAGGRALGLSRDKASKLVAALERRVGQRLLDRSTRAVTPTAAGAAYLDRVAPALAALDAADRAMRDADARPVGRLAVHAPLSWGMSALAPRCASFRAAHPDVMLDLTLDDRPVDPAPDNADVVIRIAERFTGDAAVARLGVIARRLYAAPAYLEAHGAPASPHDLSEHACIGYAPGPADWLLECAGEARRVAVRPVLTANVGLVVRAALAAGDGIGPLPDFLADDGMAAGELAPVLPSWALPPLTIHALTVPVLRHAPKVAAFLAFLREGSAGAEAGVAGEGVQDRSR